MLELLRRREFTIGLIAPFSIRGAKAQDIIAGKMPFEKDITHGDVTLRLFRDITAAGNHLNVAISCTDKRTNIAIVTAFYKRRIRLPDSGAEVDAVLSETRVGSAVNPQIPLLLDPFEKYPVDSLAFIKVEMGSSTGKYEFKPEA